MADMKSVKVRYVDRPRDPASAITVERLYTVQLGNSVMVRFSSRRNAEAFRAQATEFVTQVMHEANLLLAEAYTAYRMAWPLFSSPKHEAMAVLVRDAEAGLDFAGNDRGGPDAIMHQWRRLAGALDHIREFAMSVERLYAKNRSHPMARMQADVLARRCAELLGALRAYGTDVEASAGYRPSPWQ